MYWGPAAPWYPWPVPRCLPMIWSHNGVKSQLMRRICLAPWQRQDKAAWCLLMVQSQRLKLLIKFVEIYTVCQFGEIITESETYMSLRSEGVNLHESLSPLGPTWPVWDEAECRDFEACKIPQLANMGIKMGCQPWDCAMSIPHTQNSVRRGLGCLNLNKAQWI